MADISNTQAIGKQVTSVLDNEDETVLTFSSGETLRTRKRPLKDMENLLVAAEKAMVAHNAQPIASAHAGVIMIFAADDGAG